VEGGGDGGSKMRVGPGGDDDLRVSNWTGDASGRSNFRRSAKKLISGAFEFFFFLFLKAAH